MMRLSCQMSRTARLAAASNNSADTDKACYFERIITKAPAPSDPNNPDDDEFAGHMHFPYSGDKIPASCFLAGGRVGYRIRTGNQFLVTRNGQQPWRMSLSDLFGPGGTVKNCLRSTLY